MALSLCTDFECFLKSLGFTDASGGLHSGELSNTKGQTAPPKPHNCLLAGPSVPPTPWPEARSAWPRLQTTRSVCDVRKFPVFSTFIFLSVVFSYLHSLHSNKSNTSNTQSTRRASAAAMAAGACASSRRACVPRGSIGGHCGHQRGGAGAAADEQGERRLELPRIPDEERGRPGDGMEDPHP
jgi:hypothetical protein